MTQHTASVDVVGPIIDGQDTVWTEQALSLVGAIERKFRKCRQDVLSARQDFQQKLDAGELPRFLAETADVRRFEWKVRPAPSPLLDRGLKNTELLGCLVITSELNLGALPGRQRG